MLEIITLPVLTDNYIYLIHDPVSHETAVVDPALAQPVLDMLQQKGVGSSLTFGTPITTQTTLVAISSLNNKPAVRSLQRKRIVPGFLASTKVSVKVMSSHWAAIRPALFSRPVIHGRILFTILLKTNSCFAVIPCSRWAVGVCLKVRRNRCGKAYKN
jgi:hypothetical protein